MRTFTNKVMNGIGILAMGAFIASCNSPMGIWALTRRAAGGFTRHQPGTVESRPGRNLRGIRRRSRRHQPGNQDDDRRRHGHHRRLDDDHRLSQRDLQLCRDSPERGCGDRQRVHQRSAGIGQRFRVCQTGSRRCAGRLQ